MASSYTGLGTELMTTGENAGTWGTTTNTNLQIIEQISGGYTAQSIARFIKQQRYLFLMDQQVQLLDIEL
jgi:hypothetical protein